MGAVGNAATWAGKILKMDRRLVALKRKQHKAQLAVASKIRKRDDRIAQLERYLTGEASHDAQIHDKTHTLREELCILDPSRKKPDCWTVTFGVKKFTQQLYSRRLSRKLSELSELSDTSFSDLSEVDLLTDLSFSDLSEADLLST